MARIKTEIYEIDGHTIEVNFNCSKSGVFSTSLPFSMVEKLGIERGKLESTSLSDIENTISKAFIAYKEANTSYNLKIAIKFGACGDFTKLPDGEWNKMFMGGNDSPYILRNHFSEIGSVIGLDYEVLIEENRDGRITYHHAVPKDRLDIIRSWQKEVGNFVTLESRRLSSKVKLIDYSEFALQNLQSITVQLQKASAFLVDLVSSEEIELILNSGSLKVIEEGS